MTAHRLGQPVAREAVHDERVVVGPDAATVVRDGQEAGVRRGERPHAPPGEQRVLDEVAGDALRHGRSDRAAPEEVAHVGRQRVDDAFVAVERETEVVRAGDRSVHPKGRLDPSLDLGRATAELGDPLASGAVGFEHLRARPQRIHQVPLDLDRGDRTPCEHAVGRLDRVPGILPGLIDEAATAVPAVLDEAIAVGVAPGQRPIESALDRGHEPFDGVRGDAPAVNLGHERDEQQRGVDRPVVDVTEEPASDGERPGAQLVKDLARLLGADPVDPSALERREHLEAVDGELRCERQGHVRGDQRVASEERHEPRDPGRDDDPIRPVRARDAERAEIGDRPPVDVAKDVVVRLEGREAGLPAARPIGHRVGDEPKGVAPAARFIPDTVVDRDDVDARPPHLPSLDFDPVADRSARQLGGRLGHDADHHRPVGRLAATRQLDHALRRPDRPAKSSGGPVQ